MLILQDVTMSHKQIPCFPLIAAFKIPLQTKSLLSTSLLKKESPPAVAELETLPGEHSVISVSSIQFILQYIFTIPLCLPARSSVMIIGALKYLHQNTSPIPSIFRVPAFHGA